MACRRSKISLKLPLDKIAKVWYNIINWAQTATKLLPR